MRGNSGDGGDLEDGEEVEGKKESDLIQRRLNRNDSIQNSSKLEMSHEYFNEHAMRKSVRFEV